MAFALALSLVVVAYNNFLNHWGPFHGPAYVPLNLTFAAAVTLVSAATLELSGTELGLRSDILDAAVSLATVAAFGMGAFALARSRHAHRIADRRVAGLHGSAVGYHVLVRIPLGTAVAEEVIFRGVLFAVWRDAGASTIGAALWAALAFGLWHVSPTIIGIRINDPAVAGHKLGAAVAGAVVLTTIVGLGLTWFRVESGTLVGPMVLHGGINSVSALAAVRAGRHRMAR